MGEIFLWEVVSALFTVIGTCWVLATKWRFRLSHMLMAVFTYGALLVPAKWYLEDMQEMLPFMMVSLFPMLGFGIMIGGRNEEFIRWNRPDSSWLPWIFFIFGLLTPMMAIPIIFALTGLIVSASLTNVNLAFASLAVLLISFVPVTFTCYRKVHEGRTNRGSTAA